NWLAGKRVAIVDDKPGVTRDRVSYLMCHEGRYFDLVDTGGMGFHDSDNLTDHVEDQISQAIDSASIILFVVDTRAGLVPMDQEIANRLRLLNVPIVLLANKTDGESLDNHADEFYRLGYGKPLKVSTLQNRNRPVLLNRIVELLPKPDDGEIESSCEESVVKAATVGRHTEGKSPFVDSLVQADRMIVSEMPGTTRDSVDVRFELDGKPFIAIDTPGIRRAQSRKEDIDFYGT